jgi:hypothetical protein
MIEKLVDEDRNHGRQKRIFWAPLPPPSFMRDAAAWIGFGATMDSSRAAAPAKPARDLSGLCLDYRVRTLVGSNSGRTGPKTGDFSGGSVDEQERDVGKPNKPMTSLASRMPAVPSFALLQRPGTRSLAHWNRFPGKAG